MVKKVIITEAILYFLIVGEASESIDLALWECFVGVEQVIGSVWRLLFVRLFDCIAVLASFVCVICFFVFCTVVLYVRD